MLINTETNTHTTMLEEGEGERDGGGRGGSITVNTVDSCLLGDSGGVVNSPDLCPASLRSLGSFYFRCVLSSQWKAVTVNLRILNCQL